MSGYRKQTVPAACSHAGLARQGGNDVVAVLVPRVIWQGAHETKFDNPAHALKFLA